MPHVIVSYYVVQNGNKRFRAFAAVNCNPRRQRSRNLAQVSLSLSLSRSRGDAYNSRFDAQFKEIFGIRAGEDSLPAR